jgi:hypothetical protein
MSGEDNGKRTSLSLTKLSSLMNDHAYSMVSTYCVGNEVHFIEARTPKLQKTFIIRVPPKYRMESDEDYKRFQITPTSLLSSRQLDYLMEIKGPFMECDVVSISSSMVCLYRNNGSIEYYKCGDYEVVDDELPLEPEIGGVEQVIRDANELMERLDPPLETEEETGPKEEEWDEGAELSTEESDQQVAIELEFEETSQPEVKEAETPKLPPIENKRRDNPLPPGMEDADISLGIVYYSIDVGTFYKKAATLEDTILDIYNTLDDNEDELRGMKVTEITLLTEKIVQKAKDISQKIKKDESELKGQLITLSAILEKTEGFKAKIEKDRKKFSDVKPDIDRVYTQTRNTIYDINVELLRVRDSAEDLLSSIQTSLEEILNI